MENSAYGIDQLLQRCTVRVWSRQGRKVGTGFFIAPGRIVTCAHVLAERTAEGQEVKLEWGARTLSGNLVKLFPDPCPQEDIFPDIALLKVSETDHPTVFLDPEYAKGDAISSWGYSDLRPAGESIFGTCDGDAKYDHSPDGHLIKFKEAQIRPGISGAPLLNGRTSAVCGMIKRTRDSESDLGGLAIRAELLLHYLRETVGEDAARQKQSAEWCCVRSQLDVRFQEYLATLKRFTSSAYRVLPLPHGLGIDEVYVPLRARSLDPDVVTGTFDVKEVFRNLSFSPKSRNLLLEGAPGAGKSTLLRHIAHNVFDNPSELGLDDRRIPLLLRLQSLAKSSALSFEDRLLAAIGNAKDYELPVRPEPGFFSEWPKRHGAKWVLLLDGFDEVSTENRAEIKEFIQRLEGLGCELVVTTRPTESLGSFARTFNKYRIDPFSAEQQRLLAEKWFDENAGAFLAQVYETGGNFLGSTPLLLTIAASVFGADKRLPSKRVHLYQRFIDCWWQEAVARGVLGELGYEFADYALTGLQDIAIIMTRRSDVSEIDQFTDELVEVFAHKFGKSADVVRPQTIRFLEIMGRRSGVFIARGKDCEWLHRTFREYFCAKGFQDIDPDSASAVDIAKNWKNDQWRQIILFCISIWSERRPVSQLIKRISKLSLPYGLVFASDAIAEGTGIDNELQRDIVDGLCREAFSNAEGTICNRWLAGISTDSNKRAEQTLRALAQLKTQPAAESGFSQLVKALTSYARSYKLTLKSSAVNDLAALGCKSEVLSLANDKSVPDLIRYEAGAELHKLGNSAEGISALHALIAEKPLSPRLSTHILDALGDSGGSHELLSLARSKSLDLKLRIYVAEIFDKRAMLDELNDLAHDQSLEPEIRHRAIIGSLGKGSLADAQQVIKQLFIVRSPTTEEAQKVVDILADMKNWDALLSVVEYPGVPSSALERCVSRLASKERLDDLLYIVRHKNLPEEPRWLAAKAAQKHGKAPEVADVLLPFYAERLVHKPVDIETLKERANMYLGLGQTAEAIDDLDKIIVLNPEDEWSLGLRANARRRSGDYAKAIVDFDRSLAIDKQDPWDLFRRGLSHWHLSHWSQAVMDFSAAQELGSKEKDIYQYLAAGLYELDKYEEAFGAACKALNLDFVSSMAYAVRGSIYSATARWREAVLDLSQALTLSPSYRFPLQRRAIVYRCLNQFDLCLDDLNALLRLSANDQWARFNRCEVSLRTKDYATAAQDISLLSPDGHKPGWLVYLGWLLSKARNRDFEVEELALRMTKTETENILASTPTDLYRKSNLAIYEVALGDPGKARSLYKEMIADNKLRFLRTVALPELEDFAAIFPERANASILCTDILAEVETLLAKYDIPGGGTMTQETDDKTVRITHPVYCPLRYIQGLEKEKSRGEKLISQHAGHLKVVVLWRLHGDWLYGQCNFKADPNHPYNLKFVDKLETILNRNVEIFAEGGVHKLFFLEQELLDRFVANRDSDFGSPMDYELIKDNETELEAAI